MPFAATWRNLPKKWRALEIAESAESSSVFPAEAGNGEAKQCFVHLHNE